jgi:6-phosphofructokinase 1
MLLLLEGKSGVTVSGVMGNEVRYMPSKQAIEQRHVDLKKVALYEEMGICFGRKVERFVPEFKEITKAPDRIY